MYLVLSAFTSRVVSIRASVFVLGICVNLPIDLYHQHRPKLGLSHSTSVPLPCSTYSLQLFWGDSYSIPISADD
jgi:hypothetical protein